MKTFPFFLIVPLLANGCSLLVRSGGTYEGQFFHETATRETIEHQLGKPILTQRFGAPKYLYEVPELEPIALLFGLKRGQMVSFREDFHYRGWIRQEGDNGGNLFFGVITAGLSELILFPLSIIGRVADATKLHTFQVWFSPDGNYVYHRRMDD